MPQFRSVAAEPVVDVEGVGVADADVASGAADVTGGWGEGAQQPASNKIAATPRPTFCLRIRQMIMAPAAKSYG